MSERHASPVAVVVALSLLGASLAPRPLAAQPAPEQTVWLKNGGFVRGALVELVPGDHVTLQLVTGEIRRIASADIDHLGPGPGSPGASASAAPPPVASTAPPVAPTAPPVASVPAPGASASSPRPDQAVVRITAPSSVELQVRQRLDPGPWTTLCTAPCDRPIAVIDREFRAAGANVQPSRTFVIEAGERPLRLSVSPGSASRHHWGVLAFAIGTPLGLAGGAGYGLGRVNHQDALMYSGLGVAIAGGALLIAALPLLFTGQTRVRTERGVQVGQDGALLRF